MTDCAAEKAHSQPAVVLIGWMGCQDRYLMKYSQFYERESYARSHCSLWHLCLIVCAFVHIPQCTNTRTLRTVHYVMGNLEGLPQCAFRRSSRT